MSKEDRKYYRVEVVITDMQVNRYSSGVQDVRVYDDDLKAQISIAAADAADFAIGAPTKRCVPRMALDLIAHAAAEALADDEKQSAFDDDA